MHTETNRCLHAVAEAASRLGNSARSRREPPKWIKPLGVALFVSLLAPSAASAQVPRSASVATHAVASLYHAIGTGIATVVSRHSPITVRVQPFAGPPAWLPSMDKGDTDMGVLTSADATTSYSRPSIWLAGKRTTCRPLFKRRAFFTTALGRLE